MSILRDFIQIGESIYWSEWNVLTIEVGIEQNGLLFLFKSNNRSKFLTIEVGIEQNGLLFLFKSNNRSKFLTIEVGIKQNGLLFLFKSNNWSKFLTNGLHWVFNEGSLTNVVQP